MSERTIFLAALEISDPAQRSAYLDQACAGDFARRTYFERLLNAHQEIGSFLESPPPGLEPAPTGGAVNPSLSSGIAFDKIAARERAGDRIGPYMLLQQLGEGGMALSG